MMSFVLWSAISLRFCAMPENCIKRYIGDVVFLRDRRSAFHVGDFRTVISDEPHPPGSQTEAMIYVLALPVILILGFVVFFTYQKMKSDERKGKQL